MLIDRFSGNRNKLYSFDNLLHDFFYIDHFYRSLNGMAGTIYSVKRLVTLTEDHETITDTDKEFKAKLRNVQENYDNTLVCSTEDNNIYNIFIAR